MTPGTLSYSSSGDETLHFDIKDGHGIALARRAGLGVAVLSGRSSAALERRARELGIDTVVVGRDDKGAAFDEILAEHSIEPDEVAAIGDDLQDLPLLSRSGLSFAPADAVAEVVASVSCPLTRNGGHGAVREMIEIILRAQDLWDGLVADFRPSS